MADYALGARVRYHHRAAVARWQTKWTNPRWGLFEGARRDVMRMEDGCHEVDLFADWPEQKRGRGGIVRINKTVMIWPEEGVGVITGKVRRQRGTSEAASRGGSVFGDEWEPGYFDAVEAFDLYCVRHELRGADYILVPTWAVSPDMPATQEGQPGLAGDASV